MISVGLRKGLLRSFIWLPRFAFSLQHFLEKSQLQFLIAPKSTPSTQQEFRKLFFQDLQDFIQSVSDEEVRQKDPRAKQYCQLVTRILEQSGRELYLDEPDSVGLLLSQILSRAVALEIDVSNLLLKRSLLVKLFTGKSFSNYFISNGMAKCKLGDQFFTTIESMHGGIIRLLKKMYQENIEAQRVIDCVIRMSQQQYSNSNIPLYCIQIILDACPKNYDIDRLYLVLLQCAKNGAKSEYLVWQVLNRLKPLKDKESPIYINELVKLAKVYSNRSESQQWKTVRFMKITKAMQLNQQKLVTALEKLRESQLTWIDHIIDNIRTIKYIQQKITFQSSAKTLKKKVMPMKIAPILDFLESKQVESIDNISKIRSIVHQPSNFDMAEVKKIFCELTSRPVKPLCYLIGIILNKIYNILPVNVKDYQILIANSSILPPKSLVCIIFLLKDLKQDISLMPSLLTKLEPTMASRLENPLYMDTHLFFYAYLLKYVQKRNIVDIVKFDQKIIQTIQHNCIIPNETFILYLKQISSHRQITNQQIKILMKVLEKCVHNITHIHVLVTLFDRLKLKQPDHIMLKQNIMESIFKYNLSMHDLFAIYSSQVKKGSEQNIRVKDTAKSKLLKNLDLIELSKTGFHIGMFLLSLAMDDPVEARQLYLKNQQIFTAKIDQSLQIVNLRNKILLNQFAQALHMMDLLTPALSQPIRKFIKQVQPTPTNLSYKEIQALNFVKSKGQFDIKIHPEFFPYSYDLLINGKLVVNCHGYQHYHNQHKDQLRKQHVQKLGLKFICIFSKDELEQKLGPLLIQLKK